MRCGCRHGPTRYPAHRPPDSTTGLRGCVGVVPRRGWRALAIWSKGPDPTGRTPRHRGAVDGIRKAVTGNGIDAGTTIRDDHDGRRQPRDLDGRCYAGDQPARAGLTMAQAGGNLPDQQPTHQRVSRFPAALRSTNRPPRHGRRRRHLVGNKCGRHQRGFACVIPSHRV
ncbi:Uncharacterised protein [Mycobacterium tuberculosis]|nr:Uncharacterised protein [Mycobacterium tuberculosis]